MAGIVTPESASYFARQAAANPHCPQRHWRWAAFRDWTEERGQLTADECRAVYALGESDPDTNLGTAMMCRAVLDHSCPPELRDAARRCERPAVRRVAR